MSNAVNLSNALIESVVGAAITQPIKWPNAPFNTPNGSPWVRVTPMYSVPTQLTYSGTDELIGVLQIDVFDVPDAGDLLGAQISDQIRQAFPQDGNKITSGGVSVQFSSIGIKGSGADGTWYKTMIEARFYSFVDRNA